LVFIRYSWFLVKFPDHSETLEFRAFFQLSHIPISTLSCHLISHSPSHLTPLILSLTHGRPSGHPRDTSPLPFHTKPPCIYPISISFTKSPTYIILFICKSPFFSSTSTRELLQNPLISSTKTLASRIHLKTSRTHLGLHHKGFISNHQPQGNTKIHSFNPSFNNNSWIEAIIFFILDQTPNPTHPCEYLTHQDLDSSLYSCDVNSWTLAP